MKADCEIDFRPYRKRTACDGKELPAEGIETAFSVAAHIPKVTSE